MEFKGQAQFLSVDFSQRAPGSNFLKKKKKTQITSCIFSPLFKKKKKKVQLVISANRSLAFTLASEIPPGMGLPPQPGGSCRTSAKPGHRARAPKQPCSTQSGAGSDRAATTRHRPGPAWPEQLQERSARPGGPLSPLP